MLLLQTSSLEFGDAMEASDFGVVRNWTVAADEHGSHLAVSAEADTTLHGTLHRDIDILNGNVFLEQAHGGEAHHDFRSTDHGNRV